MSDCNILEDLKALEEGLLEREDILKAIKDLRDKFVEDNPVQDPPSRYGIEITPGAPRFSGNFPRTLSVPMVDTEWMIDSENSVITTQEQNQRSVDNFVNNGEAVSFALFQLIPENLTGYPVWDAALRKYTNGCEGNVVFGVDGDSEIVYEYDNETLFISEKDQKILDEYYADPDNIKWSQWKVIGGGVWSKDLNEMIDDPDDPGNPVLYEAFDPDSFDALKSSGTIEATINIDSDSGLGYIDFLLKGFSYVDEIHGYDFPVKFFVQNGNGRDVIEITFVISLFERNDIPKVTSTLEFTEVLDGSE